MRRGNPQSQLLPSMSTYNDTSNDMFNGIVEPSIDHISGENISNHGRKVQGLHGIVYI